MIDRQQFHFTLAWAFGLMLFTVTAGCNFIRGGSASSSSGVADSAYGQLGVSAPTATGVVAKIENGLQGTGTDHSSGNFARALKQVSANLPQVTDPTRATGYDQVQILIYAACSDLTQGSTPQMQAVYQVNAKKPIALNQTALVAAGMKMMDQYTAGIASQGPASAQLMARFSTLIQQISTMSSGSSTMAFMSVCVAANTAGSMMLGF